MIIKPKKELHGSFRIPGDKSISHRAVMFGSIAKGTTEIEGFLNGADCLSTIDCFQKLGIEIDITPEKVFVHGQGLRGLITPTETLDVGNSGTTLRLMTGLLAAQTFPSEITGDASIQKRPMDRVVRPLRDMNAVIKSLNSDVSEKIFAPLRIQGKRLKGIRYILPVASAQVKSALLLAGLYAHGDTIITEPMPTRDHTEIMANYLGAEIEVRPGGNIICHPVKELYAKKISVPGDISSAAYFMAAAAIRPDSHITIENVGINKTRTGIITALESMGANIQISKQRVECGEPVGNISVSSSNLHSITIGGSLIPLLIDEIPVLAATACFAEGVTVIKDAEELKVKESNRIKTVVEELHKLGADIEETGDGMIIRGGKPLHGAELESHGDHRIAMALSIAALGAEGETKINNAQCVDISFPGFYDYISNL